VEIAGGLVGDQQLRRRGKRPGDRHALLLAARKLAGIVRQTLAQPDGRQLAPRDLESVAYIGQLQRPRDVSQRGHVGNEVEGLEDDADIAAAEIRHLVLVHRVQACAVDVDLAAVQPFETGKHHQQCRLAGTGRADNANRFARIDRKVDPLQHMNGGGRLAECEIGFFQIDDGFGQGILPYMYLEQLECQQSRNSYMSFKATVGFFASLAITALLSSGIARAEPVKLVGFGDSLMAGYQLPVTDAFPVKLEAALRAKGYAVEIANAGVSGDTTSGGLSRLDWSIPDGTQGVILELGANDALRGIAPEESEKNLDAMLTRLK